MPLTFYWVWPFWFILNLTSYTGYSNQYIGERHNGTYHMTGLEIQLYLTLCGLHHIYTNTDDRISIDLSFRDFRCKHLNLLIKGLYIQDFHWQNEISETKKISNKNVLSKLRSLIQQKEDPSWCADHPYMKLSWQFKWKITIQKVFIFYYKQPEQTRIHSTP